MKYLGQNEGTSILVIFAKLLRLSIDIRWNFVTLIRGILLNSYMQSFFFWPCICKAHQIAESIQSAEREKKTNITNRLPTNMTNAHRTVN